MARYFEERLELVEVHGAVVSGQWSVASKTRDRTRSSSEPCQVYGQ